MKKYLAALFLCCFSLLNGLDPIVILLGPPGSGKGTFSQFLKENYKVKHVSAGDLIRKEVENKTEIGVQISEIVKNGQYIDPLIINKMIAQKVEAFAKSGCSFIIDGFGRERSKIIFLYNLLSDYQLLDRCCVVFLNTEDQECKNRIYSRMVCNNCGHVYNLERAKPKKNSFCDVCGKKLNKRINDNKQIINKRLLDYRKNIEKEYLFQASLYPSIKINTKRSIDDCLSCYKNLYFFLKKTNNINDLSLFAGKAA
jgi:adenylate kinase